MVSTETNLSVVTVLTYVVWLSESNLIVHLVCNGSRGLDHHNYHTLIQYFWYKNDKYWGVMWKIILPCHLIGPVLLMQGRYNLVEMTYIWDITHKPSSVTKMPTHVWLYHSCNHTKCINPYPTAFPYGNGMVLHFYQQQESSTTKTVHKVINKRLKTYIVASHWWEFTLTFRHHASHILGQAFRYSPENAFYIFNQQIYYIIWYLLDLASLI